MSSRGRGYGGYSGGRGSYGGGRSSGYRGGGSYRGGSSRGSYEGRGGRGGGYSSYNNDSRYSSSGGSRYASSRDRIDDSYKKSYRSETSTGYSSRDYGRSGSPDRKRMRIEGSSSERRSHEGGHYGSSYSRPETYSSERRSFGEERRRSPARESYRKPSGMGPPRDTRPMRSRPMRRSFRGRTMRSRASFRGTRSRGSFASRRYGDRSLGYVRAFKTIKRGSSPVKSKDEDEASSTEEEWDADEKDDVTEEKKEKKAKSPKAEGEAEEGSDVGEGAEADETDKEAEEPSEPAPRARPAPKIACVHCKEKCLNFPSYSKHLLTKKHRLAMGAVAARHKAQLMRMRVAQRGAQREIEAAAADGDGELAARSTFCMVCRLNYRTTRAQHNMSDTHRAMKRFLMPFCRVCRINFRTPMLYEHHICSVGHIKKARNPLRRNSPKEDGSGDEAMDVDLENFMTLDSVGDVDEVEDDDSGDGEKKDEEKKKKPKVEINIGSEHLKKVEVWWCELCKVCLPRCEAGSGEEAEARRRHCRMRLHLSCYVQHRDTRTLRKQAERIHRQLHQQKEEEKAAAEGATEKVKEEKQEPAEDKKKLENGTDSAKDSGEDKLWADVDKDLGELLSEVDQQGNEGSDDEDELNRYDKFRKSNKLSKTVDGEENEANAEEAANEKNGEITTSA